MNNLDKALARTVASFKKKFNDEAAMVLAGDRFSKPKWWVKTGLTFLDCSIKSTEKRPTGFGLPGGKIIEVFGPEQQGKTSLALQILAHVQKAGGMVGYIDAEYALEEGFAERLFGINSKRLLYLQPDDLEEGFAHMIYAIQSFRKADDGVPIVLVLDSLPALMSRNVDLDQSTGMAEPARIMSKKMPKLVKTCARCQATVIIINQIREKPGVVFGDRETTTGGKALRFYASIRIRVGSGGQIRKKTVGRKRDRVIGINCDIYVKKNKFAEPFRSAIVPFYYKTGFNDLEALVIFGTTNGGLPKDGNRWAWKDQRYSKKALRQALQADTKLFKQFRRDMALEFTK